VWPKPDDRELDMSKRISKAGYAAVIGV